MRFPFKIVDMTHRLSEGAPSWNGGCGFKLSIASDYDESFEAVRFRVQNIHMAAGMGTHIDAPAHCMPNGVFVADLDLNDLIVPCVIIDISLTCKENTVFSIGDVRAFELKYGTIEAGSFVIIRTGWDRFWSAPERYRNNMIFPTVSIDAIETLLHRGIVGLGVDTLSPDGPESGYPVHQRILGAGKYIIENIANAGSMPIMGGYSAALPIKISEGTEAPIRLVGLIKN